MKIILFLPTMALLSLLPACHESHAESHEESHAILATTPLRKDIVTFQDYVCQIHSSRHIEICAFETGYLDKIPVKEGQEVAGGETLFQIVPVIFQAELQASEAEARVAELEYRNTEKLAEQKVVSPNEVALARAKYDKALAEVALARAHLEFTRIKAPFSGIIDRFHHQEGSLVEEGTPLTTLSDNQTMWVYFNVPEARYLAYRSEKRNKEDLKVELILADGSRFEEEGRIGAIEADFNNETGNIAFRADFSNSEGILRHGQTGTIRLSRPLPDALLVPQRATFEVLDKRFLFVIDDEGVVHQRRIEVLHQLEDALVISDGIETGDRIVYEGIRHVRDGETVHYETIGAEEVMNSLKLYAE